MELLVPDHRQDRNTLGFLLSEHRNLSATRRFFRQAITGNGVPDRVAINRSGANLEGLQTTVVIVKFRANGEQITVSQVKYNRIGLK